ncbi:tripartite tricarboxylate transporter substrate binding protein [Mesorhizobium sp. SB112]|uniref:Bug family tripartite tricarboxylate transporter substrate binding protein n=1 Tax=Mesorhizobium sp. SB112 TaxID=3151853 RepID=UPI0032659B0B
MAAVAAFVRPAAAQDYPERDIQYIVQSGVGGGSDILARTLAKVLREENLTSARVLVENRPGGAGAIAYNYIAQQSGNPYILGGVGVSFFTTPLLGNSAINYKSFTPLAGIARSPYILAVRTGSPIDSIDYIKAHAGLRVGTAAAVSDPTLLANMLSQQTGAELRVVPFDGEGEVLTAMLGGHIDLVFGNPNEIIEQVKARALTPIAVTSKERIPALQDVPTFQELGVEIVHSQLRGVIMPPDQDPEVIRYWEDVLRRVAESDAWRTQYVDRFSEVPDFVGSEAFAAEMEKTNTLYDRMMRELKIIQ